VTAVMRPETELELELEWPADVELEWELCRHGEPEPYAATPADELRPDRLVFEEVRRSGLVDEIRLSGEPMWTLTRSEHVDPGDRVVVRVPR
jgi:hypothetical protein